MCFLNALTVFLATYQSQSKHSRLVLQKKMIFFKKQNLYRMEFDCLKTTEPLRGDSLLFTTKLPGMPGTYFIYLEG